MRDGVVAEVPRHPVEAGGPGAHEGAHQGARRVPDLDARSVLDRVGKPVVEVGTVGGIGGPIDPLPMRRKIVPVEEEGGGPGRGEDRLVRHRHRHRHAVALEMQVR